MSVNGASGLAMGKTTSEASQLFGSQAVSELTSYEQRDLLDAIDKLRRASIPGEDLCVPQIVVCGDQSAGKSSVLEAISQLRFPIGTGTTTRFATEVVLRNSLLTLTSPVTLKILAHTSRTLEQKAHIESFSFDVDAQKSEGFSEAVAAALAHLQTYEPKAKFWYDRLHVEILGPTQPNLTLVDLPGLIQSEVSGITSDRDRVKELVKSYISEPKAIVLAVLTSINDVHNQEIIQLVKESKDAIGRTIGVLTKTDRLITGSEEEANALLYARNKKITLGLGWHALRNTHQERQDVLASFSHRDEVEQDFFSQWPWSRLASEDAGIGALREKLSRHLFGCITHDLPKFLDLMQAKLQDSKERLEKLGTARDTPESQGYHLQHIQRDLQSLIKVALDGHHGSSDFESFFDGSPRKALRTTINRRNREFATRMRCQGKQFQICDSLYDKYELDSDEPNFYPPYQATTGETAPKIIPLKVYCRALAAYMGDTRGTSLQGFQATSTQTAIFKQQSVFWAAISRDYIDTCYAAVMDFLKIAVIFVGGRYTGEKLMRTFVDPLFVEIGRKLEAKLDELLWPYRKSHPSTQNPRYTSRVSPAKSPQDSDSIQNGEERGEQTDVAIWTEEAKRQKFDHDLVFAAEAIDTTDAYYDLALDTFIDNVTILGVEAMLLDKLRGLLSYEDIASLKPNELSEIAAEPPGAQRRRDQLRTQVNVLVEVIGTCKKYKQQDLGQHEESLSATVSGGSDGRKPSATLASISLHTSSGNMFRGGSRAATDSKQKPVSLFGEGSIDSNASKPTSSSSLVQESSSATAVLEQSPFTSFRGGSSSGTVLKPTPSSTFSGGSLNSSTAPKSASFGSVLGEGPSTTTSKPTSSSRSFGGSFDLSTSPKPPSFGGSFGGGSSADTVAKQTSPAPQQKPSGGLFGATPSPSSTLNQTSSGGVFGSFGRSQPKSESPFGAVPSSSTPFAGFGSTSTFNTPERVPSQASTKHFRQLRRNREDPNRRYDLNITSDEECVCVETLDDSRSSLVR